MANRTATRIDDRKGVRLAAAAGDGVAWVEGSDFQSGTIEVDVRGREYMGQSFVGVAFHRKDDKTYEAVYVRPFNFRASDPIRKQHAVQYIALPEFDFDRLRKDSPEEFENPVDPSLGSTDWVKLRVVVRGGKSCRSTSAPSMRPPSKCGSLASSMAARSACGWATKAAATSRISSSHRRNNVPTMRQAR